MEFKAVLASVGVAAAWGTGQVRDMKAPKVEPKAREQTRTWGYVLEGFPVHLAPLGHSPTTERLLTNPTSGW